MDCSSLYFSSSKPGWAFDTAHIAASKIIPVKTLIEFSGNRFGSRNLRGATYLDSNLPWETLCSVLCVVAGILTAEGRKDTVFESGTTISSKTQNSKPSSRILLGSSNGSWPLSKWAIRAQCTTCLQEAVQSWLWHTRQQLYLYRWIRSNKRIHKRCYHLSVADKLTNNQLRFKRKAQRFYLVIFIRCYNPSNIAITVAGAKQPPSS